MTYVIVVRPRSLPWEGHTCSECRSLLGMNEPGYFTDDNDIPARDSYFCELCAEALAAMGKLRFRNRVGERYIG